MPVNAEEISSRLTVLMLSSYNSSNLVNSSVFLIFDNVNIFSFASVLTLFFNFSRIILGLTPIYFTGLPILTIANPFFSKLSRTSYVLDLGTLEIEATSPAEAIPFPSKASHTFVS